MEGRRGQEGASGGFNLTRSRFPSLLVDKGAATYKISEILHYCYLTHAYAILTNVSDPYSFYPDPAFSAKNRSGSGSRVSMTIHLKSLQLKQN